MKFSYKIIDLMKLLILFTLLFVNIVNVSGQKRASVDFDELLSLVKWKILKENEFAQHIMLNHIQTDIENLFEDRDLRKLDCSMYLDMPDQNKVDDLIFKINKYQLLIDELKLSDPIVALVSSPAYTMENILIKKRNGANGRGIKDVFINYKPTNYSNENMKDVFFMQEIDFCKKLDNILDYFSTKPSKLDNSISSDVHEMAYLNRGGVGPIYTTFTDLFMDEKKIHSVQDMISYLCNSPFEEKTKDPLKGPLFENQRVKFFESLVGVEKTQEGIKNIKHKLKLVKRAANFSSPLKCKPSFLIGNEEVFLIEGQLPDKNSIKPINERNKFAIDSLPPIGVELVIMDRKRAKEFQNQVDSLKDASIALSECLERHQDDPYVCYLSNLKFKSMNNDKQNMERIIEICSMLKKGGSSKDFDEMESERIQRSIDYRKLIIDECQKISEKVLGKDCVVKGDQQARPDSQNHLYKGGTDVSVLNHSLEKDRAKLHNYGSELSKMKVNNKVVMAIVEEPSFRLPHGVLRDEPRWNHSDKTKNQKNISLHTVYVNGQRTRMSYWVKVKESLVKKHDLHVHIHVHE